MEKSSTDTYKIVVGMDDIVEVILKADQYEYQDLKQRNIQKLKHILYTSKTVQESRMLLNIHSDFTDEEEEFYCHDSYWKATQKFMSDPIRRSLSEQVLFSNPENKDLTVSDVMINPMILKECGKHIYFFLRKRKLLKTIDESHIIHCENCKCTFNMIYRKHHCRSCGKVFCYQCCYKRIDVPKEFLSFQQTSIFSLSYFIKDEKVCDNCYSEIYEYHTCKTLIRFFQITSLEIPLLQRCATLSKIWRKAVLFYLSFVREIQYKLLHLPLEDYEMKFLYANRNILASHSSWMLQLLKLELSSEILEMKKISNCWDCMCTRVCHPGLDIFDAFVILILENKYPKEIQHKALSILKNTNQEKWIYFLTFFFSRWSNKQEIESPTKKKEIESDFDHLSLNSRWTEEIQGGLFDLLIEFSRNSPKIFSILYWGFSVCSFSKSRRIYEHLKERLLLESPGFSKTFIGILNLLSHCEDYYQHQDMNLFLKNLSKGTHSFCPINPERKIIKIHCSEVKIKKSITTPIYIPYECDDGKKYAILFKREDIRKDAAAMAMAKLCKQLLEENGIQVPFISYDVVPTSPSSGFIEIVQHSRTLHDIFLEGTINNYLQIHNPDKKIGEILENYMKSLSFSVVFTYILGVGDRHLENIMLTSDGILFNIDYSWLMGEPKPYIPAIRIDEKMLEGIGGSQQYQKFKKICCEMFLCLRRYASLIFCCFLTFASCDPPIENSKYKVEFLENHLIERFLLGQNEQDVVQIFDKLIDNSKDAVSHKLSDYIHSYTSKMQDTTQKGFFSWFYANKK
jgi:phosphatidylinositol kinase/protein kinase (PI-3  family)